MTMPIKQIAVRLDNDRNGDPRYFLGLADTAEALGVSKYELECRHKEWRLRKYSGKRYGFGFVFNTHDLAGELNEIARFATAEVVISYEGTVLGVGNTAVQARKDFRKTVQRREGIERWDFIPKLKDCKVVERKLADMYGWVDVE